MKRREEEGGEGEGNDTKSAGLITGVGLSAAPERLAGHDDEEEEGQKQS